MNVMSQPTYSNVQAMARYLRRVAPIVAADPLAHLERVLIGSKAKAELQSRPIPKHRALVPVGE